MKKELLLTSLVIILSAYQAQAAQGTGTAKMKVVTAVSVNTVSDLVFSEASAGAAAETVDADQTETAQNASFDIAGEPNRAVIVTLPQDGIVKMATAGGGSADTEVAVNQFTSNSISQIDPSGTSTLFVGATRDALSPTQTAGDYEGNFIVDVVYQ